MNDDPPEIVVAQHVVGPDNRSDGLRTATNACDDVLPNIRIESFRAIFRIMQASDRESHSDDKAQTVVTDRFLQHDKAAGVFLFIRDHTTEGDFPAKGIQRILRIEDGGFDTEYFQLLQVTAAGIANSNQRR